MNVAVGFNPRKGLAKGFRRVATIEIRSAFRLIPPSRSDGGHFVGVPWVETHGYNQPPVPGEEHSPLASTFRRLDVDILSVPVENLTLYVDILWFPVTFCGFLSTLDEFLSTWNEFLSTFCGWLSTLGRLMSTWTASLSTLRRPMSTWKVRRSTGTRGRLTRKEKSI
jgi:hypothetical protein